MAERDDSLVVLHLYDLSQGMMRYVNARAPNGVGVAAFAQGHLDRVASRGAS